MSDKPIVNNKKAAEIVNSIEDDFLKFEDKLRNLLANILKYI